MSVGGYCTAKGQGIGVRGRGGNPQYRCIQITDPFIHNNSPLIISFFSSFIHVDGVYCVALLTQLSFEHPPPTPSLFTYSVPVPHNESATCLFKERFWGMELACPIGSSIIKIIPMVMCSPSGFVIQVIKRRSACLTRPKIFKPANDGC